MKTPLPKATGVKKIMHKTCAEPGCDVEFEGFAVSKYCDIHRDPRLRKKKDKEPGDHKYNALIKHSYTEVVTVETSCRTCGHGFRLKLHPKQFIYPAMCEKCRIH